MLLESFFISQQLVCPRDDKYGCNQIANFPLIFVLTFLGKLPGLRGFLMGDGARGRDLVLEVVEFLLAVLIFCLLFLLRLLLQAVVGNGIEVGSGEIGGVSVHLHFAFHNGCAGSVHAAGGSATEPVHDPCILCFHDLRHRGGLSHAFTLLVDELLQVVPVGNHLA